MDVFEYQARLKELINTASSQTADAIIVPAAVKLLASIKNRIQQEGKNSADNKMAGYSKTPMYASKEQFAKPSAFKPIGKNGTERVTTFSTTNQKKQRVAVRDGRPRQTMYLPGGYEQLRAIQGKNVANKDNTYTGSLMASYVLQKDGAAVLLGLTSMEQARKREGLEKRQGKTFYATTNELKIYNDEVTAAVNQVTLNALGGA